MSAYLLFVVISLTCFRESESSAEYKITDWRRCPDSKTRYLAIPQISIEQCVHECKVRPVCKAISYQRLLRLCEIYSTEVDLGLKPSAGRTPCVFIARKDIKQDTITCNCTDGQVCNTSSGSCSIKECSPYDNGGGSVTVHGNRNEVKSKIKLSCQSNGGNLKQTSICNSYGNWSQRLECPHQECPDGDEWLQQDIMPNFELQFNMQKMTHPKAKQSCENSGNRLVRIDSIVKREYIKGIGTLCEGLNTDFWTDGSNFLGDAAMRFSDKNAMPLGGTFWEKGRPDNSDTRDRCARSQPNIGYRWRDAYCEEPFPFICEKP
ncbi:uncharacterized protein LOC132718460 [Ruditapes philippinarum]|uniref:uncharacterized protein LOC132718460 n=1 Tax=Ruditapes philippinarum TaxID=129788 RepID=UPI00295C2D24|nr:uncharacterized protein LOC132718460 [Ruditapes philippinarum]